jgi:hypothetical protein
MEAAPEFVWGIFTRALGLVFVVAFGAIIPQILPLAGSRGLSPQKPLFQAIRRDCGIAAFWWLPSILHVSTSDRLIQALPIVGALLGAAVIVGGPLTPYLLFLCWLVLLSLDPVLGLQYPWDAFLLEIGFLAAWLPPLQYVWESANSIAAPTPLLAFCFHWLEFRLLFGFGKMKFAGATSADRLYIKGFLISQPIPSKGAWFAYNVLPDVAWVVSVYGMATVELLLPLGAFFPGWPRQLFAIGTIGLMVCGSGLHSISGPGHHSLSHILQFGIMTTGTFGYFNVVTACGALSLFDSSTLWSTSIASHVLDTPAHAAFAALWLLYLFPASVRASCSDALSFLDSAAYHVAWVFCSFCTSS